MNFLSNLYLILLIEKKSELNFFTHEKNLNLTKKIFEKKIKKKYLA